MRKALIVILAPLCCWATKSAHAGCEDILKYINYDITSNYQQLTTDQVQMASFCSESYNKQEGTRSAQIEASYSLAHAGAQGTEREIKEEQQKQCHGNYGRDYLSSLGIQQSQLVSSRAVDALTACYLSTQFQLKRLTSVTDSFSADFSWNGPNTIYFNGVEVSGRPQSKAAACLVRSGGQTNITQPFQLASGTTVTVICQRRSKVVTNNKSRVSYDEYPEGLVTVISAFSSIAIPLIKVSKILGQEERIANIEEQTKAATKNIDEKLKNIKQETENKLVAVNGRLDGMAAKADVTTQINDAFSKKTAHVLFYSDGHLNSVCSSAWLRLPTRSSSAHPQD